MMGTDLFSFTDTTRMAIGYPNSADRKGEGTFATPHGICVDAGPVKNRLLFVTGPITLFNSLISKATTRNPYIWITSQLGHFGQTYDRTGIACQNHSLNEKNEVVVRLGDDVESVSKKEKRAPREKRYLEEW